MGAVPKRRISKARKGRKNSHIALEAPEVSRCPKCGEAKRPHFKCEYCGHYGTYEKASKKSAKKKGKDKS